MKTTVLKFGLYGGIVMVALFLISYQFMDTLSFATQEVLGYLSMFVALTFVFFGIRSYRDNQNNHTITFGRAFGLGILIALVPAVLFGTFDALYVTFVYPEFFDDYLAASIAEMQKTLSGDELAAKIAEMQQMKEWAENPFFTFALMFITVLLLGLIISLISAIILKKAGPDGAVLDSGQ